MKTAWLSTLFALTAAAFSSPVAAQSRSGALDPLMTCRGVADRAERLACFDRAAEALADAVSQGRVAVVDRETVRATRRSLFGLDLPALPFLGSGVDADEAPKEISATATSVQPAGRGLWVVTLDDESVWQSAESRRGVSQPRAGDVLTIRKAAAGGYMMKVGSALVRVKRLR